MRDNLSQEFNEILKEFAKPFGEACRTAGKQLGLRAVYFSGELIQCAISNREGYPFVRNMLAKCPKDTMLMDCDGQITRLQAGFDESGRGCFYDRYCVILMSKEFEPGKPGDIIPPLETKYRG